MYIDIIIVWQIARRVQVLPLLSGYLNVQPYCQHDAHELTMFDESGTSKVAPGMEVLFSSARHSNVE